MQDGGVPARSDDGGVRRTLAAVLHQLLDDDARNRAFGRAGAHAAHHRELGLNGCVGGFVKEGDFAGIFDCAKLVGEFADVGEIERLVTAEGGRCPCGERLGLRGVGLAPKRRQRRRSVRCQVVEQRGELIHGLDRVDSRLGGCARGVRAELLSGVELHAHVTRGEEEDFAVGTRGARAFGWCCSFDKQGGAGLVPSGEVVEVGVLAVGHEVELGLLGGEKDGDSAVELFGKMHAAGVVVGGGLAFESESLNCEDGKTDERRGAEDRFHRWQCTRWSARVSP